MIFFSKIINSFSNKKETNRKMLLVLCSLKSKINYIITLLQQYNATGYTLFFYKHITVPNTHYVRTYNIILLHAHNLTTYSLC